MLVVFSLNILNTGHVAQASNLGQYHPKQKLIHKFAVDMKAV